MAAPEPGGLAWAEQSAEDALARKQPGEVPGLVELLAEDGGRRGRLGLQVQRRQLRGIGRFVSRQG